ncbi:MAG: hypothetical protein IJU59_06640, partial [Firmicutes bacterium]|nr:hypothetical protein [Bacillota bacterium]
LKPGFTLGFFMNIFIFLEDEDLEDEDTKVITKGDLSPNLPKGEFGACPQIGKRRTKCFRS